MVNFGKRESWLIAKVSVIWIFDKSERSKTSKNSVKIVVSLQNFGRFLSLRPEVVPISPKISQLLSFQRKFIHLRNWPIIRLHLALSAKKVVSKEQSSALFFLQKSKNCRVLFDHIFCLHWCLTYCFCRKIFYIQKFSQFDEFVSDFALHRRLTTESTNTCSSPETWKISQSKVIKILQRTMKTNAKLCKSHERNLINIKATDKSPSLNNFVLIF